MTGVSINTVTKLLVDAGKACDKYQHDHLRNLSCKRLELDEIWSFVYAKARNVTPLMAGEVEGAGSRWKWTAIELESKLFVSYLVGERDGEHACAFVADIAERIKHRIQITTDGLKAYLVAIKKSFGTQVDYGIFHKVYGPTVDAGRYARPVRRMRIGHRHRCTGAQACFHQLRRTPKPDDANAHAAVHPADEWLFQEAGKPLACYRPTLHALQRRPPPHDAADVPRDEGRRLGSLVDDGRIGRNDRPA